MVNLHRASTPSEQSREVLTDAVELYVLDHIDYHLIRIRELLHAHIYRCVIYVYLYICRYIYIYILYIYRN